MFGLKGVPIRINIYNSCHNSAVAVGGEHGYVLEVMAKVDLDEEEKDEHMWVMNLRG